MAIIEGNCVRLVEYPENLLLNLYQLYSYNMFVDMCIVCHGSEVFAHKAIIAAASPLLRERINKCGDCHVRINLENELSGININVEDIKLLIEFIYKGQVFVPETRVSLFLEVANHFQVTGLYRQSNLGGQVPFLPQPVNSYPISQPAFPNFELGVQNQDNFNYEDPSELHDYGNHGFHGLFQNNSFMSPEKLSDSTIKQDKSLSGPVTNATFSDLCAGNGPIETYSTDTDRNIHLRLNAEETNPKLSCDFPHYTNEISTQDTSEFSTITGNPFSSDFSENSIQVISEPRKDIFEDRTSMSSSGASDPDILFTNLNNQPNSIFNSGTLDLTISSDHNYLPDIPFQPCKIPVHSPLPERQMRLKVKDSIGGVSLQDTSQGERSACNKNFPLSTDETPINADDSLPVSLEEQSDHEVILENSVESLEVETLNQVCSQCQKSFSTEDDLHNHLYEEHSIGTIHKCLLCNYKSVIENRLVDHGKSIHLGSGDRQCCVCGKRFKTRATLRNHLSCHDSDNWFKCTKCSVHYSQRSNLTKHLASAHRLDVKGSPIKQPSACSHCSFVTWAPHKLKNHEIRCHTKDKPFKCSECSYSATERTSLVKHLRIHTQERPYICDLCGLSFVTISSLKRHSRGHTNEKPFQCQKCGQQYADKKRLKDHHLKHKSIKPFKCTVCEYSCRRKDNLKSHMRRSHPNDCPIEEIIIEDPH